MGAFSGLKDAKRGFASNPLKPGTYVVRIEECAFFETPQNGEMWKNTLTVLAVQEGPHRVGEITNTFFRTAAGKSTFQGNLKSFMATVLDVEDSQIDEDAALKASGEEQKMRGLVTVVKATQRTSKKKTNDKTGEPLEYTVYSWSASLDDKEVLAAIGKEAYAQFFPSGS